MAVNSVLFCLALFIVKVNSDILCENGFCGRHIRQNPCADPAPDCDLNNGTHSGVWLPSPTICNCCKFCLPMYNKGAPCSIGGPGTGITVGRCGEGLTCDSTTRVCVRMKTKCHDAQDDYDARQARSQTGYMEVRPECDAKGNFLSNVCVPSQTCFCQSEDGERIFGEVANTGSVSMPCTCSRLFHKIRKTISTSVPFPVVSYRCTSDGNFNPVQCFDRKCHCVDKITGIKTGTDVVDLDEQGITDLPCYEADLDLFRPRNISQRPFQYTTPCYDSVEERRQLIGQSKKDGYNVDYFSTFTSINCLPDGTFGRTLINANGTKVCINERSVRIGNYEAKINTPQYDEMDCKCAISSSLLSSSERPHCCSNGNFRPIQCRRGSCYCVDSDGRQEGMQTADINSLPCYTDNWRNC
ncbi:unnamed protein product [Danaus chrysippus]|uniref:(African queen) hypothetical protein n=1 Tax=Danaus chrysippus TaxID=151541 RepID=A0A8J2QYT4_9NEOP|nr:unnamed protein product [Danaus chrysippus]